MFYSFKVLSAMISIAFFWQYWKFYQKWAKKTKNKYGSETK